MKHSDSPIRGLYSEHNGIVIMLEILDSINTSLMHGRYIPKSHLNQIIGFLTGFADLCHHGKEENLLIPELIKSRRTDKNLINEILGEHKTGRDLIQGMRTALNNYQEGNSETYHFAANAKSYTEMLMVHIRKENVILFPQAEDVLDNNQKKKLGSSFEDLEENVVGKGIHEEYHQLLKRLQQKYL